MFNIYVCFICICPIYIIILGVSNLRRNCFTIFSKLSKKIINLIVAICILLGVVGTGVIPFYGLSYFLKGLPGVLGPSVLETILFHMTTTIPAIIQTIIFILIYSNIRINIKKYQENPEGGKTKCQE